MVHVYLEFLFVVTDRTSEDVVKQIHVKLPANLHRRLKVQATMHDTTIQEYVIETLENRISGDEASGAATEYGKGE